MATLAAGLCHFPRVGGQCSCCPGSATPFLPRPSPPTRRPAAYLVRRSLAVSVRAEAAPATQPTMATPTRTSTGRHVVPGRTLLVTRTPEAAAAHSQALETPTASLSRVVYSTVQPAARVGAARTAGAGRGAGSPFSSVIPSILVLAATVGAAAAAALRARAKSVRECRSCHGYGVQRCKLCAGRGTIEWEGKMAHREPCPMCLGKRMNTCTCCGGGPLLTRHLFAHKHRSGRDVAVLSLQEGGGQRSRGSSSRLGGLLRRLRREDAQEGAVQASEAFAEEVMTD